MHFFFLYIHCISQSKSFLGMPYQICTTLEEHEILTIIWDNVTGNPPPTHLNVGDL